MNETAEGDGAEQEEKRAGDPKDSQNGNSQRSRDQVAEI